MGRQIRIEIRAKDQFWGRAFHVEWQDQFGERELASDEEGHYLVDPEWLDDLNAVARQTYCRVLLAPESPGRRRWINSLGGRN